MYKKLKPTLIVNKKAAPIRSGFFIAVGGGIEPPEGS
jgi:hypothetical protein